MGDELLSREQYTIQKRESVYGTDEIDLANNLAVNHRFEAYDDVSVVMNGDFRERNINRTNFDPSRGQYIPNNQTWTVEGVLPVATTAGDLDKHGVSDLLVASGMSEALSAGVTSTYTLSTQATAGLTMYHWRRLADSGTEKFTFGTGIRGDMVISGTVRDYVTFSFTGQSNNYPESTDAAGMKGWSKDLDFIDASDGSFNLQKTGATIVYTGTQTGDTALGLFLETAAILTIGGQAYPVTGFTIPFNNTVTQRVRTSASVSGGPVFITGRSIQPSFQFETETEWEDAATHMLANDELSSTLVLTDGLGTGGTTVTFTWPKLQLRQLDGPNDTGGLAGYVLGTQANGDHSDGLGDDSMSIVYSVTP